MKKYKIVIEIETPEKVNRSLLTEVCENLEEEFLQEDLFGMDSVVVKWKQQFIATSKDGYKVMTEGMTEEMVKKNLKILHPTREFKIIGEFEDD